MPENPVSEVCTTAAVLWVRDQYQVTAYAQVAIANREGRIVKRLRNGKNQAVSIRLELVLPGPQVVMRREGERLTIETLRKHGLAGLLRRTWRTATL